MKDKIYDIIGIGIGPFNLGMAALTAPLTELSAVFLDQSPSFSWHPGLMLSDATLQVPFMADLVTMADPTSPYSFLNFMKQTDRLYKFYIKEDFYILRKEYNAYCKWVIAQLPSCRFGQKVISTAYNESQACYELLVEDQKTFEKVMYYTRRLVLGTGTVPKIPESCGHGVHPHVIHTSQYLDFKRQLLQQKSVSIIGSGQSAAEIFNDLLPETENGMQLNWFTRPDRFFPLEYSKLTLELTSPEYVDYFHNLPAEKRRLVLAKQNQLFKGINYDLINQIFDKLYELSFDQEELNVRLSTNCQLNTITVVEEGGYHLSFYHTEQEQEFLQQTDFVVMATGYQYKEPSFLKGIADRIVRTEDQQYHVGRHYTIDHQGSEIFVQNAELHTHGFVTPDLGMGAYRNSVIINTILGREVYKAEKRIAFQQFGVEKTNELLTIETLNDELQAL
ncbi:SidA/IucD/PvdA family monooxygenase [Pedobacter sp. MC2016-15]|uniref:lysine N(6)-hydroxylase/L-ornithine N(5)-oxygenase family protein n=1 Tax=Pedobacter sp. MC2016-15 TaxID=2994473 RepID=UPI002248120D|nr:SidA/IucD/PvdA family monooxygenase [Pedobacter sp. MC2016-15]MCX2480319.1 SidA/IucD/PvdA family monooxygenase [Pedobacter sp. MC2016-15]